MSDAGMIVSNWFSEYFSLFKAGPSLLLTYTGLAAYAFASGWTDFLGMIVFFIFGSLATFGSNTLNNYFDRDTDALMSRTQKRPLPRGLVNPVHAFIIGITMLTLSVVTFSIWFNPLSAGLMILGSVYYSLFYTLYLKKRTSLNTVIGGFAGSLPILTGWAAATGGVGPEAVLFALIVFLWTPGHFWSLALKFKDDYRKARIPTLSTITNIRITVKWIIVFNFLNALSIGLSIIVIVPTIYRLLASVSLVLLTISSLILYLRQNESRAWQAYKISSPALGLIFTGLLLSFI